MTSTSTSPEGVTPRALEGWQFVQMVLADLTARVTAEAETELELFDGLRMLARVAALCSELTVDADRERPWFFPMNTPLRYVGGPNPDGAYHLCSIDGTRRYRLTGQRGTCRYLGFQVLAGRGLDSRRMTGYVSDRDLAVAEGGRFALVLSNSEPSADELDGATWVAIPEDASAVVVRQYVADAADETLATYDIEPLRDPGPPAAATDDELGAAFTAMGWTIARLATLHELAPMKEAMANPNQFFSYHAAQLGFENSTPDNLYVLGSWRLGPDDALVVETTPPQTRFWNLVAETIWHECIDYRRRASSVTDATAVRHADGAVRLVLASRDPGVPNWVDVGGRHRGFMTFRWIDNPAPPELTTMVMPVDEVARLDGGAA
ncbi:MAG: DUF1214 domain-containing protein [Acidimicrobiales bacterium]